MNPISTIGVMGGGAWGTALAQVAATAGRNVTLWAFEPDVVATINEEHENKVFLAGLPLLSLMRSLPLSRPSISARS
jgi:glycerol-3-phosphate dehydrogenase (NAD(P)+)